MLPRRADAGTAAGNHRRTEVPLWNQRGARTRAPLLPNGPPSSLVSYYGVAWFGSQLRTSNDHHSKRSLQARLYFLFKGWSGSTPYCAHRPSTTIKCSFQARSLLLQGGGLVGPSPRASREHILIVRPLRAQGTTKLSRHVSIISNRASNSCPQAVQRMQSDSTVNSSDLIPMPPQSGQRASWTL
jgi:hypothetical protein